jgi:hypothetical protein
MSVIEQFIYIIRVIRPRFLGGSGVWIKCGVRCRIYWGSQNAYRETEGSLEHSIETSIKVT